MIDYLLVKSLFCRLSTLVIVAGESGDPSAPKLAILGPPYALALA